MISQLGSHLGKQVIFGFDRYILPELDAYNRILSSFGIPVPAVATNHLHYLTSAEKVSERMQGQGDHVGILICATGMGMSIAANKFRGVYAARCVSSEDAKLARIINNANVLCLAARSGLESNQQIIETFMTTIYSGRKLDQLQYISQLELEGAPVPDQFAPPYSRRSA